MVPKFKLVKLGELNINDFHYESKKTSDDKVTGFKLFEFLE